MKTNNLEAVSKPLQEFQELQYQMSLVILKKAIQLHNWNKTEEKIYWKIQTDLSSKIDYRNVVKHKFQKIWGDVQAEHLAASFIDKFDTNVNLFLINLNKEQMARFVKFNFDEN